MVYGFGARSKLSAENPCASGARYARGTTVQLLARASFGEIEKGRGIVFSHSTSFLHLRGLFYFKVESLRLSANLLYSLFYRRFLPPTYVNTPLGRRTAIFPQNLPRLKRALRARHDGTLARAGIFW